MLKKFRLGVHLFLLKARAPSLHRRQPEKSGKYLLFYFIRSRRYRIWQREKKLRHLDKAVSSVDAPGLKPKASSYIRRKSSEIRKILPKSPKKAVTVLKHLWNQMYKSPRKRKVIDQLWSKDKEMGKFMYKIGKYKN